MSPPQCAPGCDTASCLKPPESFPAAKNGNTCYNPAAVGVNIDQVCCAANSCPCTSVTGKGIATKDPLTGKCPGGCDGVCDAGAIAAAAKGVINEAMALCQAPIDPAATKCCSVSSGCVCTAVGTPQKGTDFADDPAYAFTMVRDKKKVEVVVPVPRPGTVPSIAEFNGASYTLKSFNFMKGSGHRIDGRQFPLECNFVLTDPNGATLDIVLLFEVGAFNPALDALGWFNLPAENSTRTIQADFNPMDLFPLNHDYYQYEGSLPYPPCTEDMEWLVLQRPAKLSQAQLDAFPLTGNFRQPQPLNRRVVHLLTPIGVDGTDYNLWWGYSSSTGPRVWGNYFPDCQHGLQQSPINILTSNLLRPVNAVNRLQTDFATVSGLSIQNTGRAIIVTYPDASVGLDAAAQAGIRSSGGVTTFEGKPHQVIQFHWHRRSEQQLNGQDFPMEMHIVHQSEAGHYLVLCTLYTIGPRN